MAEKTITPITELDCEQTQPRLTIDPTIRASDGSEYAFNGAGYTQIVEPWAVENHIGPAKVSESFGDVDSWAEYVIRYGESDGDFPAFVTWSEKGLRAVLDYHGVAQDPNRCQWVAEHPFTLSPVWRKWAMLANGSPRSQREVLEAFEDLGADIVEPSAADLVALVRTLRATSMASADTELRPDGTTRVSYVKNQTVNAGELVLPPTLTIAIPVLKGHAEYGDDGKASPVLYRLTVRLRVSVGDDARLAFRLSLPDADRVLEAVYADRVKAARLALGADFSILRATA